MDIKTHIHIYIHETPLFTQAHKHIQMHTGKPSCAHIYVHSHTWRYTYSNLHAYKLLHVHLYTHVLAHTHLHTNSYVHIYTYRHTCIYSHLHTTHGNPHEHMCIHYTCFCTCTHTHMYLFAHGGHLVAALIWNGGHYSRTKTNHEA